MRLQLIGSKQEIGDTFSFYFKPEKGSVWIAGQSIKLELEAGYTTEERRFSISSAPFEKHIRITTRVGESGFKQALSALQPGDEINAFAIEGNFVWENTTRQKLLCAQGVGITPFRSILKQLGHAGDPANATLLYASHSGSFLFARELGELSESLQNFHTILMPRQELSAETIQKHAPDLSKTDVYLSGSSEMVDKISPALLVAGLPKPQLKQDWFTGKHGWDTT